MWAVESEQVFEDIEREMVYFKLARDFHITPEAADRLDRQMVETLLFIDGQVAEKEKRMTREMHSHGRHV